MYIVGWLVVLGLTAPLRQYFGLYLGRSGGAMLLGKLAAPGRPTNFD